MTFQITVQPSGHRFECEAGETVLGAAIRAGIGLPYGCKNGACGSCKGKVVAGAVTHTVPISSVPSPSRRKSRRLFIVLLRHHRRRTW